MSKLRLHSVIQKRLWILFLPLLFGFIAKGQIHSVDSVLSLNESFITRIASNADCRVSYADGYLVILYRAQGDSACYKVWELDNLKELYSGGFSLEGKDFVEFREIGFQKDRDVITLLDLDSVYILDPRTFNVKRSRWHRHLRSMECTPGYLFLTTYYNYQPNDRKNPLAVYKLDYDLNVLDSFIVEPEFLEYTHYGPSRLHTTNGQIHAFPLLGEYGIVLLNEDLEVIDTLRRDIPGWVSPPLALSKIIRVSFRDAAPYYHQLDKINFRGIHRIEYVQFTDQEHLLVRWFHFDSTVSPIPLRHIDIYRISPPGRPGEKPEYILESDYEELKVPHPMELPLDSGGFPVFSASYAGTYFPGGLIQLISGMEGNPYRNVSYSHYMKQQEALSETQDPCLHLWKFHTKP